MGYGRQKWHSFWKQLAAILNVPFRPNMCRTWLSPNRKEAISPFSAQFHHMPERYERVHVGWHCAKVNGHAELKMGKPRVKTLSYGFPKLHHSNTNRFRTNVHIRQFKKKNRLRHSKVTWCHTKVKVWKVEGAPKVPLCSKYGAILTIISWVTSFWKKWCVPFFFDRPPSWKFRLNRTGFRT